MAAEDLASSASRSVMATLWGKMTVMGKLGRAEDVDSQFLSSTGRLISSMSVSCEELLMKNMRSDVRGRLSDMGMHQERGRRVKPGCSWLRLGARNADAVMDTLKK